MSLDICIEYKDKTKNYIEFSENLHNKIFIQNSFYTSLQALRKIKDYYLCDESFKQKALVEFISDLKVTHRLANIRAVLSSKFDLTLEDDDMDEIERAMVDIKVWKKQGD